MATRSIVLPDEERKKRNRFWNRRYREKHAQKIYARHQAYALAHPDKVNASRKKYREKNREQLNAMYAELRKTPKHRMYMKQYHAKRRARIHGAERNDFTEEQWKKVLHLYEYRCVYCSKKFPAHRLEKDHIIPIAKGGSHTLTNIVPACRSCNATKNDGAPPVPVQPLLLEP